MPDPSITNRSSATHGSQRAVLSRGVPKATSWVRLYPRDARQRVSGSGDGALGNFAMLSVNSGPKGSQVQLTGVLGPNSLSKDRLMPYIGAPRCFADPILDMETTFEREETEKGVDY